MAELQTGLRRAVRPLPHKIFGESSREALETLEESNYQVVQGLTRGYAHDVVEMAHQPYIAANVPADCDTERFSTIQTTRHWLKAGKAVFLLLKTQEGKRKKELTGYAWAEPAKSEFVEEGESSFHMRVGYDLNGVEFRKKSLAPAYGQVILAASKEIGLEKFWLPPQSPEVRKMCFFELGFRASPQHTQYLQLPDESLASVCEIIKL